MAGIQEMFNNYLLKKSIFTNKNALTISFKPHDLPHREKEIEQLAGILAPALRGDRPSNVFMYGKSGTGKSVVAQFVAEELLKASQKSAVKVRIIYLNTKMRKVADTEYRLLAELLRNFGVEVPDTGLPTDMIYRNFFEKLDSEEQIVILVLDEIDYLVKKIGDGILYTLTRINESLKKAKVSVVGISNDLSFTDKLDPRVKSSLSEEEFVFPPYNAIQLQDILRKRADIAFIINSVDQSVISKCAALAAQEHGDARKALDLLRVSGEIAERLGDTIVTEKHVDLAQDRIDLDRISEVVKMQPKQSKAVLWSVISLCNGTGSSKLIETGDIFNFYEKVCTKSGIGCLTQRRVSDLIAELDALGIINARVVSKGRYGRTREVKLAIGDQALSRLQNIFKEEFYFE